MTTPILLVEDDPGAQDLIRALCERAGYAVDVAGDGFLGLRLLSERRHAIALIDYHLPEMDGYALARLMREIARPDAPIRLVGITADAHGLASRRGADALFDAILVKPIVPERLFSALERLTAPEAPLRPDRRETPADALWRRRGLPGRPRAILCPDLAPAAAAAIGQAFDLVDTPEACDVVLVADEAGLDRLRALRSAGPARLLPSVAVGGALGEACDLRFVVGDAESWTALGRTCAAFAHRRATLSPTAGGADDPAGRLLALLHVRDRDLVLRPGDAGPRAYETGHDPSERMAALLALMQAGHLTCDPVPDGLAVRLTDAGRRSLVDRAEGPADAAPRAAPVLDPAAAGREREPRPDASEGRAVPPTEDRIAPVLDRLRMDDLCALIGDRTVDRLRERFVAQAADAFAADAAPEAIAHDAHVLIAMAGTLGFERLSAACRALQDAVTRGDPVEACLAAARQARAEVQSWRPTG